MSGMIKNTIDDSDVKQKMGREERCTPGGVQKQRCMRGRTLLLSGLHAQQSSHTPPPRCPVCPGKPRDGGSPLLP